MLFRDLTGEKMGDWRVLYLFAKQEDGYTHTMWFCHCEACDKTEKPVSASNLQMAALRGYGGCGCKPGKGRLIHGEACVGKTTKEYKVWLGMKSRCLNPNDTVFKYYGGRGVSVCERWLTYEHFFADMGRCPPSMSIERIDNNGNYEPGNCKWASRDEQIHNRRTQYNRQLVNVDGVTMKIDDAAKVKNISLHALRKRLEMGMPADAALNTPVNRVKADAGRGIATKG